MGSRTTTTGRPKRQIPFPYVPYAVQEDLMQQVYRTLEDGKIGVLESPTGTGKSLSLICSTLQWLQDQLRRDEEESAAAAAPQAPQPPSGGGGRRVKGSEPDWLRDYGVAQQHKEAERVHRLKVERQERLRARIEKARAAPPRSLLLDDASSSPGEEAKKKKRMQQLKAKAAASSKKSGGGDEEDEDADLLPAEYRSGGEEDDSSDDDDEEDEDEVSKKEDEEGEELDRSRRKILYCSRTHSQVSQFVMEINKTVFKDSVRVISLGSRKNLCINESVSRLGSDSRISDRCLDMQKGKQTAGSSRDDDDHQPQQQQQQQHKAVGTKVGEKGAVKRQRVAITSTTKSSNKCPFLQGGQSLQDTYRDYALSRVQNIEDLATLGKSLHTCPYYGTRRSIAQADVIAMPYTLLLHKDSRESLKIPLKGNVVVIDEAHNLIEAINAVYTSHVSLTQLSRALNQISLYWERYSARLSGQNAFYVKQIIRILQSLVSYLTTTTTKQPPSSSLPAAAAGGGVAGSSSSSSTPAAAPRDKEDHSTEPTTTTTDGGGGGVVVSVNELLFEAGLDNINLFKLHKYIERSQIGKKVLGFTERRLSQVVTHPVVSPKAKEGLPSSSSSSPAAAATGGVTPSEGPADGGEGAEYFSAHVSSLQIVQSFLRTLTGADRDGRIVVTRRQHQQQPDTTSSGTVSGAVVPGLKYIMLNASTHFKQVVDEAHSVLLAGGTLQPFSQVLCQLLPQVPPQRVDLFVCGHVIPPHNLQAFSIAKGPSGVELDLTHRSRAQPHTMDELGRLLLNVCTVVPAGVVCFLPSYKYEAVVVKRWEDTGILNRINAKKQVFREPKRAKDVDQVLQAFATAITTNNNNNNSKTQGGGALLLCVVGAKMSEGINFADDLARCVVMVGLPYPDTRSDPELQQKLHFIDNLNNTTTTAGAAPLSGGGGSAVSGRSYYQGLCMRAVNQSIGRAIRHANDYATILLVDKRYQTDASIVSLLPGWIQERLVAPHQAPDFGRVFAALSRFFKHKKEEETRMGGNKP